MRARDFARILAPLGLTVLLCTARPAPTAEPPPPPPQEEGVEVQARGPVHEAFAEPTGGRPEPAPVVEKQPPDPIDEVPPDQKPAGDHVNWIPGYWAWDQDTSDFLWVSGFWRDEPPGRQWVPGHWQEVEGGWQWTPGFWMDASQDAINYVPAPPPSIDAGPSTPAPDDNSIYVPGCWVHREARFFWRPGYWVGYQPNWVWVPARYVWTPVGCVFVEGYWDHPLDDRGLLFAPVRIDRRVVKERWTFTPSYVVQPDFLVSALFVGPARHHYYFGDYFEDKYDRRGFVSWVDYRPTKQSYDPLFSHYRHEFRADEGWEKNLRALYEARRSGEVPRPPRTLVQQQEVIKNVTVNKTENVNVTKNINVTHVQNVTVLTPLARADKTPITHLGALATAKKVEHARTVELQAVAREERERQQKAGAQVREVQQKRREAEARVLADGHVPVKPEDKPHSVKLEFPKPPPPKPDKPPPKPAPTQKPPPPPPPAPPKHEEKPIPAHEPLRPSKPPKPHKDGKDGAPARPPG
jgi:WXXGXW repeat (2 copies)